MIDIVIPFYNDNDKQWRNVLKKYMLEEHSEDRQVVGEERYRDWDCFKYWFRCVEKNCPWVNKIFLILASETQIPEWLDTTHPKLRIVYHEDYIPKELLPTFNTMTIEFFISRIPDLSDNYVYCNDDYYFLNYTSPHLFFIDDIPVYNKEKENLVRLEGEYLTGSDATFYDVLNNGIDLQFEICGEKAKWYALDHIPVSHKKNFELEIINKYYDRFINANKTSRFRNKTMFSNHVFVCLYRDLHPHYKFSFINSYLVTVKKDTNFEEHKNCTMVCFNDTEQLDIKDFEEVKKRMVKFFEDKFPNKSKFEK